ncbi:hypothetical protein [Chryseobacterium chendengshani]|uniref:hypothetical protein n=1 Tax=Chryseobacterium sp. LJ756 TaxID=2864113 RepID=UPI001C64266D|nr:hypothetical protein [Chryseobacterium sp. LJ756]MBW7674320.1 hypothetical protein [Chryseobacterium sp. LJ756]
MKNFTILLSRKIDVLNIMHSGIFLKCISFLFLVFHICFVYAQDHVDLQNRDSVSVIVIKGGIIFSSDESFNQQILKKKILITGSHVSYTGDSDQKQWASSDSETKKSSDKTTIAKIKNGQKDKTAKDLHDIAAEIAKYEAKKENFQKKYISLPLSSAIFTGVQSNGKSFISPTSFQYKVDKNRQ